MPVLWGLLLPIQHLLIKPLRGPEPSASLDGLPQTLKNSDSLPIFFTSSDKRTHSTWFSFPVLYYPSTSRAVQFFSNLQGVFILFLTFCTATLTAQKATYKHHASLLSLISTINEWGLDVFVFGWEHAAIHNNKWISLKFWTHLIVHELQGEGRLPHAAAAHHDHLVQRQRALVFTFTGRHLWFLPRVCFTLSHTHAHTPTHTLQRAQTLSDLWMAEEETPVTYTYLHIE